MRQNRLAFTLLASSLALSSCALDPPAPNAYHDEGLYVGLAQTTTLVYGDLDEEWNIIGDDDIGFVPSFDGEAGVGIAPVIGYRWHTRALEFTYLFSDFGDPEYLGTPFDTTSQNVSLDLKQYYNVDSRLQPFIYAGFIYLDTEVDGAAQSLIGPEVTDLELKGQGINVGGGANYYLSPNLSLFAQITWSFTEYTRAKTVFPPDTLEGALDSDSLNLTFGASWTF